MTYRKNFNRKINKKEHNFMNVLEKFYAFLFINN